MRLSAKALLKRYGFEVEFATDGQDAIEKLAACSGDYQLVIMDLTMPRLSGHEAFSLMKAQYPHLPVIIMTGYSNLSTEALFTQQSPIAFLQKPFHTDELINIVERIPGLKLG
jgi:DNA-binding NtrC family response regulator